MANQKKKITKKQLEQYAKDLRAYQTGALEDYITQLEVDVESMDDDDSSNPPGNPPPPPGPKRP